MAVRYMADLDIDLWRGGAGGLVISYTAPANPMTGALWLDQNNWSVSTWYTDTDTPLWVKLLDVADPQPPPPTPPPGPAIVWPAHFGAFTANFTPPPDEAIITALSGRIANPRTGSVMTVPATIGTWGYCFAYPNTLPPPNLVMDTVAGNVTATYLATEVSVSLPNPTPGDPPQDYRVYFIKSAIALPVAGPTVTLTI